jgi:hypothetical protein
MMRSTVLVWMRGLSAFIESDTCPHPLSNPQIDLQAIKQWQAKAESVEPDVQRVMAEEREETALRKAEMEANKAHVGQGFGFWVRRYCSRSRIQGLRHM